MIPAQTSVERVKNAIKLKKIDKIPLDFKNLGETDLKILFVKPSKKWKPKKYKPWYFGLDFFRELSEEEKGSKREDEWGTIWGYGNVVGAIGEPLEYPIKDIKNIREYKFPDPEDPGRFDGFIQEIENNKDKHIRISIGSYLFERMHFLIGFNETMINIADHPEEMEYLLDKIVDYDIKLIRNLSTNLKGKLHGISGSDDWGTQTSLMIHPDKWRKIFKPRYKKIADEIHKNNLDFWFHSDGKIEEIIPDLIEIGADVFQFPQPSSVLGIKEFGRRFAGKACFCLYIDIQSTAVYGTEEEIIKEADELVNYWSNEYGSGIIAFDYHDHASIGSKIENSKIALKAFKKAFERKVQKYEVMK